MTMLQLVIAFLLAIELAAGSRLLKSTSNPSICETIVQGYGYPCLQDTVTTEDGFVLGMQRIPHGINDNTDNNERDPGAATFVMNTPSQSLAFILADQGYDVWLGNTRGSDASLGHISLSNQDKEFWNWSLEEHGKYDLLAMLQLIYNTTGSRSHFIGYSQGTTIGLVGLTQPKVTSLLSSVVLLNPVAFLKNITPPFTIALAHSYLEKFLFSVGINEFNPAKGVVAGELKEVCKIQGIDCSNVLEVAMGMYLKQCNNAYINRTRFPYYLQFLPQSTSTKNLALYTQMIRSGGFDRYDYGSPADNMKYYNQTTPPAIDFSTYPPNLPLLLVTGGEDGLADVPDVQRLLDSLVNCNVTHVFRPECGHADFVWGTNAHIDVYVDVANFLKSIPK
ncbi:hypothetical protein O6H91_05G028600 [Diphasiastrum complanatum]|uniref:Uncharacterized protein n=1 Tax=Diphasiastrum complanatum TaxID=34168 RepID=A0ACC2DLW9_DIPCM|nr:hypothetical protein O6H91_05G028600 [Diphasiastrum complanatum]